jgi:hypothetical protein
MTFYLHKSDKPAKKYYVEFESRINNPARNIRTKRIYFGAAGFPDFILSGGDEEKKKRYIARHKREDWSSPYAGAGFWARWILWNKPTLQSSINDTKERFNIKIISRIRNPARNIKDSNRSTRTAGGEKPSAYRSMKLAKLGLTKPTTKANRGALLNWGREKWLSLNALRDLGIKLPCGTKYKGQTEPTVCRPSIRINKKTPKPLASELTDKQITKAIAIKKKGKRSKKL